MGMNLGRKGMFYFFISIIFLSSVFILIEVTQDPGYRDVQDSVISRIYTMNDFIMDLEKDMDKAAFISSYRALIAIEEHISLGGSYLPNLDQIFEEAFVNGTIDGVNKTIMNASSFSNYIERVKLITEEIGIDLEMDITDVKLYHRNPWYVTVSFNMTNNVTDQRGLASWYYDGVQETRVTILNLRDPLYSVGTLGRVPNTIKKTNYTYFINDAGNANDTTRLMGHINDSLYIASSLAPSYVMRLKGNFSGSPYGIESLVDISKLEDQDIVTDDSKSIVDYIYFNDTWSGAVLLCENMINMPSWFRIDEDHLAMYEIDPDLNPEGAGGGYSCS